MGPPVLEALNWQQQSLTQTNMVCDADENLSKMLFTLLSFLHNHKHTHTLTLWPVYKTMYIHVHINCQSVTKICVRCSKRPL